MAYLNPKTRDSFANLYCWSSSEGGSCYHAWYQDFDFGDQNYYNKRSELHVRAVRGIKVNTLTPRQGLEEFKKGYAKAELDFKREPLSEERITELWKVNVLKDPIIYARQIEKAHGIGGYENE